MACVGAPDWYTEVYGRSAGVGDIYHQIKRLDRIPVDFRSKDIAAEHCEIAVARLRQTFGLRFYLRDIESRLDIAWQFNGIQVLVHDFGVRDALGAYHGRGIMSVKPLVMDPANAMRGYALDHEIGHGLFGFGHHGDGRFDPPRKCLMDRGQVIHPALCSDDRAVIERMRENKEEMIRSRSQSH